MRARPPASLDGAAGPQTRASITRTIPGGETIHDKLTAAVREYVLRKMPHDDSGELAAMDLRQLLQTFFNLQGRQISARPRTCHVSEELQSSAKLAEHQATIETLIGKIEAGEDLIPHLSPKAGIAHIPGVESRPLHLRPDRDLLLGEWGVHHLHLEAEHANDLVFAMFTRSDAYLIGIYEHGDWGLTDVLRIVVANWPEAGLMLETQAIGLTQDFTDQERLELRQAGINTMGVVVDGKLWMPSALGIAADGSSSRAGHRAMDFVWRLEPWETEPDKQLAAVQQAINETARQEVGGEWSADVDDEGNLRLLRGGVFCQLLSLRPAA